MSTGYTRNDTTDNISNGNVIDAADLDGEFNAIQAAFDATTGHDHDGTVGGGAPISVVGPNQEVLITANDIRPKNDNVVDLGTSILEFKDLFLDGTATIDTLQIDENATITGNLTVNGNTTLGNATTDTFTLTARLASSIVPSTDNTRDLGASTLEFKDLYLDGTATIDILQVDENATITGNLTVNGNTTLGNADTDTVTFTAGVNSSFLPLTDDAVDLGSTSKEWRNLWVDGTANIDSLVADTVSIAAGNATLAGANIIDTTGGNLTLQRNDTAITSGEVLGNLQFQAPNVAGGGNAVAVTAAIRAVSEDTFDATVNKTSLQFRTANNGAVATKVILESDGDVLPAADNTQNLGASGSRWKEVFATTLTATDLAATTLDATNLEVTNIKAKDGTASAAIANSTGVMTVNSLVATAATLGGDPKLSAASPNILDTNGNKLLSFDVNASAVNYLRINNQPLGTSPQILAVGDNSNINIGLLPKGNGFVDTLTNSSVTNGPIDTLRLQARTTGTPSVGIGNALVFQTETSADNFESGARIEAITTDVTLGSEDFDLVFKLMAGGSTAAEVARLTSQGDFKFNDSTPNILDSNSNELISFSSAGSAINNIQISNANTGLNPTLQAIGGDTNIGITLATKGDERVTTIVNSTTTNTVIESLRVQGRSSGTPATGIGTSIGFMTEAASNTFSLGGRIESVSTDLTLGSEDFDLVFSTMENGSNPSEALRLTAGKQILRGTSTALSDGLSNFPAVQFHGTTSAQSRTSFTNWDSGAPTLTFNKSPSGTVGTHTIVTDGALLGSLNFRGSDGGEFRAAAAIHAEVDGTPGLGDMPGRIVFNTTADGSSSVTERFRISNFGGFGIGGANYGIQGEVITSGGTGAAPVWSGAEYTVVTNGDTTLTSTTSAQAIFPAASDTLTLPVGTYEYEMFLYMDTMSATSGNGAFNLLGAGTATIANALSSAVGVDAGIAAGAAQGGSYWTGTTSNTAIVTATTQTSLGVYVRGVFRVSVAGTIIPSFALQTANAAVVKRDTNFRVKRLYTSATGTNYGPWA